MMRADARPFKTPLSKVIPMDPCPPIAGAKQTGTPPRDAAARFSPIRTWRFTSCLCVLAALASFFVPLKAHAGCQANAQTLVATGNATISTPSDRIPVGTRIGTWQATLSSQYVFDATYNGCGFGKYISTAFAQPASQPTGVTYVDAVTGKSYDVYAIPGVQGVGYAVGIRDYLSSSINTEIPLRSPSTQTYPFPGSSSSADSIGYQIRMVLVATGQLKSGAIPIPTVNVATLSVSGNIGGLPTTTSLTLTGGFAVNVTASGCDVNDPASRVTQTVTMPNLTVAPPVSQGAVLGSSPFTISVKCDANVAVYYTMTDASNPANVGNILRPNGNSTAQGVGIQVLDSKGAISFGRDSSANGNTNQRYFAGSGTSATQTYTVPFTAQYVLLPESSSGGGGIKGVKPGHFETAATITFSYQ